MNNYNLTEEEIQFILKWFGSSTMEDILRHAYKSIFIEACEDEVDEEGDPFPFYQMWELSCKAKSPYVK